MYISHKFQSRVERNNMFKNQEVLLQANILNITVVYVCTDESNILLIVTKFNIFNKNEGFYFP